MDILSKKSTENRVSENSCKLSEKIGHFFEREKYQPNNPPTFISILNLSGTSTLNNETTLLSTLTINNNINNLNLLQTNSIKSINKINSTSTSN